MTVLPHPCRGRVGAALAASVLAVSVSCGGGSAPAPNQAPPPVTLAGALSAPAGSAVDGDVNDPRAPLLPNNDAASAQAIPNPVILGGYVAATATGVAGDTFETSADPVDRYRTALADGQTISLFISDPAAANLDLFLFDAGGATALKKSETTNASERIVVTGSASYDIEVRASSGRSNYVLVVGQSATGAHGGPGMLSADLPFVPGEALLRFRGMDRPKPGPAARAAVRGSETAAPLLYRFDRLIHGTAAGSRQAASGTGRTERKQQTLDLIRALRRRPDVLSADPNYLRFPTAVPGDTHYPLQWHYPLISLPEAWEVSTGSTNVVVAVIDTGVMTSHPDLAAHLTTGYDFISDPARANDGDGIDADPDDPGDTLTPGSSSFHGTHVSGTVGAVSDNGSGVAGVAWDVSLMPLRALGVGGGTSADILQALRYAAGLSNNSGTVPAVPADIINLSLGGPGSSAAEQAEFTAVRNQGTLIVAAAGNEGGNQPSYPAAYDGVVSVSAVGPAKTPASYSNFGATVDVAAPGGDMSVDLNQDGYPDGVLSTFVDDSAGPRQPVFAFAQGTSMAAPHVAGVAALMKSVYGGLTPGDFDGLLQAGSLTTDFGQAGISGYGAGVIDAFKAVKEANGLQTGTPLPPILSVTPSALSFGAAVDSLPVVIDNVGGPSLAVTQATVDAPWLLATPVTVDPATGLGTYQVTVDRTGLADGIYAGALTVTTDTAGTRTVPITMQVGVSAVSGGDAGLQHVLLINARFGTVVDHLRVTAAGGSSAFRFTGVGQGGYYLVAGTDLDNDGKICDAGEACGGYPTAGDLSIISVSGTGRVDLDFVTGFGVGLASAVTAREAERNPSGVLPVVRAVTGGGAVVLRAGGAGIAYR